MDVRKIEVSTEFELGDTAADIRRKREDRKERERKDVMILEAIQQIVRESG